MRNKQDQLTTRIWAEEPEDDDPFTATRCYLSGYDVYGELVGKLGFVEYLYLLFRLELPTERETELLQVIAVAIANPGIRDHSVRAAMNAGAGGSSRASALMAALAVGAGNLGGGREVVEMYRLWLRAGKSLSAWQQAIAEPTLERDDVWLPMEHVAGFAPHGVSCSEPVIATLKQLVVLAGEGSRLAWLACHRIDLETQAGYPLALSGVIATALLDLGFDEGQAEMLYLLLRLPGAAAHALEQEAQGWRGYPFFADDLKPMTDEGYRQIVNEWEGHNEGS